ncbi:hypothetical protein FRC12_000974 [Ceratobasidium sp. 428]|nr:hypothetical protein FRC12_000974 [Ceratobasidium sp. 428]
MSSESSYTPKLTQLRNAIRLLPPSLPSGSAVYDFCNWTPDPDQLDDFGAECSVLNAHLGRFFGLRNVDIFAQYFTGNYAEKPVIAKWLDDLIDSAEHMSSVALPAKRASKPSTAQKRSNKWKEEETKEKTQRKQAKIAKAEAVSKRAAEVAKTAQSLNWSFDDLFKSQLAAYLRSEYPFIFPPTAPTSFSPLKFWTEKEKHPDANLLAPVAIKLFSLVPNSMAEERTVSCFTKLNAKDRSRHKVSTLVHMTRIRQHLIRERANKKPVRTADLWLLEIY